MTSKYEPIVKRKLRRSVDLSAVKRVELKVCKECRAELPATEDYYGYKIIRRKNGVKRWLVPRCRACDRTKRLRDNERDPDRRYWHRIRRTYGITQSQFETMLADQGDACAICRKHVTQKGRLRMVVDHDHDTGSVRGILCAWCNTALGHFRDDPEVLVSAINYLERAAHRTGGQ